MKRCPQCGHINDDDSGFCVIDGTLLGDAGRVFVSLDEPEVPTQWVPVPPAQPAQPPAVRPGFIYGVIGALLAAVLLMGGYITFLSRAEKNEPVLTIGAPTPLPGADGIVDTANRRPSNTAANAANAAANAFPAPANAMNSAANAPAANAARRGETKGQFNERAYSGTVGDNGVQMVLTKNGRYLGGRVIPNDRYADIYLEGYIDSDGSFAMNEKSDLGVVTGIYRGRLNSDGTLSGTWSKPDGDKPRSVYLRRQ